MQYIISQLIVLQYFGINVFYFDIRIFYIHDYLSTSG